MEEVDQIILHSLRSLNVDFDDNVKSISGFTSDVIYSSCVKCLSVISPEKQFKATLPRAMSARVGGCAEVAQAIKDLGFRGDLGYHQLLYPNENDTRNLLNWLTSKLPRVAEDDDKKEISGEYLQQAIENKLKNILKETWTPSFAIYSKNRKNYSRVNNFHSSKIDTPFLTINHAQSREEADQVLDDIRRNQEYVTKQPKRRIDVYPSILELNTSTKTEEDEIKEEWETNGLDSGLKNPWQYRTNKRSKVVKQMGEYIRYSLDDADAKFAKQIEQQQQKQAEYKKKGKANRFTNLVDFSQDKTTSIAPQETEEDIKKRRDDEIAELENQINSLKSRLELVNKNIEGFQTTIRQNQASIITEDQKKIALEEKYRIDKKIFEELLPDAANNIRILQEISQSSSMKLMELATEWEKHRSVLVEKYRLLKESNINRKGGSADLLAHIKKMREQMKELETDIARKDERYQELLALYNQLPKNMNRSVYTNRILESVKQIKKQKIEINKILLDNRTLQKEINTNIETLGRTFALTNEVIYLDAKSSTVDPKNKKAKKPEDNTAKSAYKQLVSIHDKFKELSNKVTETGNLINSIADLEEKMQQLTIRAGSLDIDRITEDLKQIQDENKVLLKKLGNF